MSKSTHIDNDGKARMVDVSGKNSSLRIAKAKAIVFLSKEAFLSVKENKIQKGDVLAVAKIAGIQAAKKTSEIVPLCHNIFLSFVDLNFHLNEKENCIEIESEAKTDSMRGVEMEAMTAVSVAALTIYDMCKGLDKSILISDIQLLSKTGGKSGDYKRAI